jgi:hypothetical protein
MVVAGEGIPAKPQYRQQRRGHRQNKTQTPEGMRALEIAKVDTLREFFG